MHVLAQYWSITVSLIGPMMATSTGPFKLCTLAEYWASNGRLCTGPAMDQNWASTGPVGHTVRF